MRDLGEKDLMITTTAIAAADWQSTIYITAISTNYSINYTTSTTILRLSGYRLDVVPGWAGTRSNIHPLTLSASCIYCDPWYPPCTIYVPDSLFAQPLSNCSIKWMSWNEQTSHKVIKSY